MFSDALEEALFRKEHHEQDGYSQSHIGSTNVVDILSALAKELQKFNSSKAQGPAQHAVDTTDHAVVSPTVSHISHASTSHGPLLHSDKPRKRRRVDSCGNPNVNLSQPLKEDLVDITTSLPSADILEETIDVYFEAIQPWIPILHETQFRKRIHNHAELPNLVVVLHAIVVAAIRFVDMPLSLSVDEVERLTRQSRNAVRLTAMEHLSVENLQGLIILAFNDVSEQTCLNFWCYLQGTDH